MKKRILTGIIVISSLTLAACRGKEESSESAVTQQADTESATETVTEVAADNMDLANVGTYIGADGSYMTLLDDGTADYYYTAYDEIEHGNEWSCVNGTLFVTLNDMESKISADIPATGNEYQFVEISGHWDDEKFRKVTSNSETPSMEEYQRLRAEAVPMQDKEQMNGFNSATNVTCVVGGMQFEVPSYWTEIDTEVEDAVGYAIQDGDPYTVMFIEHYQNGEVLNSSDAIDCAQYVKVLVNSQGTTWLSRCEKVSDQVATAMGTTVVQNDQDYDIEFSIAFRIQENTEDLYLVQVYQPLDSEKGYFDDAVRIAESGTIVQDGTSVESTQNTTDPAATDESVNGLDPEFKQAMDSYEAFFDKYVEFMNTYRASSNSVEMIAQYAEFMKQYADTMAKLEAIDESQLTPAEDAYYLEVMSRINVKLLQAAQ